jgi:hypothetical protein
MTAERFMKIGLAHAWASPVVTIALWVLIWTRPAGTFQDQGGMLILLIYFPLVFVVWLYCTLATSFLIYRAKKSEPPPSEGEMRKSRRRILWLRAGGLLLSVGTLFIV